MEVIAGSFAGKAVVSGTPKQAIELGAAKQVMSLEEVADTRRNGISTWGMGIADYLKDKPGNNFKGT